MLSKGGGGRGGGDSKYLYMKYVGDWEKEDKLETSLSYIVRLCQKKVKEIMVAFHSYNPRSQRLKQEGYHVFKDI